MTKVFIWFKNKFLTKKFITFGIIGVVNTLVDAIVLKLYYNGFSDIGFHYYVGKALSFTVATIGSYFMNSYFTFKEEKFSFKSFMSMFIVFLIKLVVTLILAGILQEIFILIFKTEEYNYYAAVLSSFAMIPVSFLVLDKVFDKIKFNNKNEASK